MFSSKISSQATSEHPHPLTPTSQHQPINRSHSFTYTGPGPGSAEGVGVTYRDLESVLAGLGLVSDSKLEIKSESSSSSTSATNDNDSAVIAHRAPMTTTSSGNSSSNHRNKPTSPTPASAQSSSTTNATSAASNSSSVQTCRKKATRSEYTTNIAPTTTASSSSDPSIDYPDDGGRTVRLTPTEHEQVWDGLPPHLNKLVRVPCLVYDRMTGDLITRFSTIHEASAQTIKGHNSDQKVSMYTIVKICEGDIEPTGDITYEYEDTVHLTKVVGEKGSSDPDKGRCMYACMRV